MPLILPDGLIATVAPSTDPLLGARVTSYRFDMLDTEENLIGTLSSAELGGSLSWDAYASIKGGGSIQVTDVGQQIDWLNVRIRPTAILQRAGGGTDPVNTEVPLGVFLCTAPVEGWTATGRSWNVELLDKNSILDTDIVTDSNGDPVTYVAPIGANVIDVVKSIIADAGESSPAILTGDKVLSASMTWPVETTRLRIINDLLDAAGYASLWVDGAGQYQARPWITPALRIRVYDLLAPFSKGETSLMDPDWTRDRDFYGIPNRYVVVGVGDDTTEALTAVATNVDPNSPFSYPSRGNRWITSTEVGVEAVDQEALDLIAYRRLLAADSVSTSISVKHAFLPELLVNSTVMFTNPDAELSIVCSVLKTEIPFDPTGLCTSQLQEVK